VPHGTPISKGITPAINRIVIAGAVAALLGVAPASAQTVTITPHAVAITVDRVECHPDHPDAGTSFAYCDDDQDGIDFDLHMETNSWMSVGAYDPPPASRDGTVTLQPHAAAITLGDIHCQPVHPPFATSFLLCSDEQDSVDFWVHGIADQIWLQVIPR
jgi:hypothetical protein